jgi:hypothetical protein
MFTKTIFAAATLVTAVGTMGIIAGAPAADAAQALAPGQPTRECNPGQNPACGPPGQDPTGNPGQCQKTNQEFPALLDRQSAHTACHFEAP